MYYQLILNSTGPWRMNSSSMVKISLQKGITKKIFPQRRDYYESVDETSLSLVMSQKSKKRIILVMKG